MRVRTEVLLNFKERLQNIPKLKLKDSFVKKRAAVFVPFCEHENQTCLLYTKRSQNLSKHKGEISFPGGLADEGDISIEDTAIRETSEELGIPRCVPLMFSLNDKIEARNQLRIIGKFSEALSASSYGVTPVIGFLHNFDLNEMKPNREEVEEVFTVPISYLYDESNAGHKEIASPIANSKHIRTKYYNTPNGVIWGLTAYFTDMILKELYKCISNDESSSPL